MDPDTAPAAREVTATGMHRCARLWRWQSTAPVTILDGRGCQRRRAEGALPFVLGRSYHSSCAVGDKVLIWGGIRPGKEEGCSITAGHDAHVFCLSSRSWSLVKGADDEVVCGGRSSHAAVAYRDQALLIGGKFTTKVGRMGAGTDRTERLLAFDLAGDGRWLPPPPIESCAAAARSGHSATLVSSPTPRG